MRHLKILRQGFIIPLQLIVFLGAISFPGIAQAALSQAEGTADRAVQIARQSRERVERNGKRLKASSHGLFKEFAARTVELQKLIDTRGQLEKAGLLTKGDPEGDIRRANINARIIKEVGELKKVCDGNLDSLLQSLDTFDEAVSSSLVDTQATRSINSNYELSLEQYLKQEKNRFDKAALDARTTLDAYRDAGGDEALKKRLLRKYNRAKKRVLQIAQRRKLYEARIKASEMNQKISGLIREKIREDGHIIAGKFRQVMADLYNTFAKIVPIAEIGGTGSPGMLSNLGFSNVEEVHKTLDIVDGAIDKLGNVLDDMVNDVLTGLGEIRVVNDSIVEGKSFSLEEEVEFLSRQREAWNS